MKGKYLVSWVGNADIKGLQEAGRAPGMGGPLRTVLEHYGGKYFSAVHVLHTTSVDIGPHASALQRQLEHFAPCELHAILDMDPGHPEHVYEPCSQF